jgi:Protein of unknown function (DUF2778)/L,D-transpeptidase catalytic domain
MWIYSQRLGALYRRNSDVDNATYVATGYAGVNDGLNNPDMQCMHKLGPIPQGDYTIGAPVSGPSPFALPLTPDPTNDMCNPPRDSFYIHGDRNEPALPFNASEGCIVMNLTVRRNIWASGDTRLRVIAEQP